MELKNEKNSGVVEFDLDLSDEEAKKLAEIGLEMIAQDKDELINYAVNHILYEMVSKLEKDNTILTKLIDKAY